MMKGEQVLLRFEGMPDRVMAADDLGGWPLPDVFAVAGDGEAASFSADPKQFDMPGVRLFEKVSESQLTDEQIESMSHVIRGAEYKERPR